MFTNDTKASSEMISAIDKVLASENGVVTEDNVHIPGYGILSYERAHKEAMSSAALANEHAKANNHSHAAYQYERAARFHKALHDHLGKANEHFAKSQVHADKASALIANMTESVTNNPGYGYHGEMAAKHGTGHADKHYANMHKTVASATGETNHTKIRDYLDSAHGRHLADAHTWPEMQTKEHLHNHIKKDFHKFSTTYNPEHFKEETSIVEKKEVDPELGRVQDKFRRNMARNMKKRDAEKGEKKDKEEKFK